jgi:cyclophilin family peptidyl-prolyl cis-trans isomerase
VAAKFYDQCRFFRVLDNFMVQFGIAADPSVQQTWKHEILNDDPVLETNRRGTMTYATSGKNTRTTQLFINTNKKAEGNKFLDKQGFAPFAQVLEGMEFVDQINKEYGEKPVQGKIVRKGNEYLAEDFPRLSYIVSIREIVEQPKGM